MIRKIIFPISEMPKSTPIAMAAATAASLFALSVDTEVASDSHEENTLHYFVKR